VAEWDERKSRYRPVKLSLEDEIEVDARVRASGCPRCGSFMKKLAPNVWECSKCKCSDCGHFSYFCFGLSRGR